LPVRRADTEVFLAAVADGDDLAGFLHFVEDLLDGFGEVAGSWFRLCRVRMSRIGRFADWSVRGP
jgi:hypothetical protein